MDHDALEKRVRRIEDFLDENGGAGWRMTGPRARHVASQKADLVVDEDQTKRDRAALGLDGQDAQGGAPGRDNAKKPGAALDRNKVNQNPGEGLGVTDQDGRTAGAMAPGTGAGSGPAVAGIEPNSGEQNKLLGVGTETEQALETANDPNRAARAAEQVAGKNTAELAGGAARPPKPA